MEFGKAADPAQVVRDILAAGPVPATQFRQRCYDAGIPKNDIAKACRAAGAKHRRRGPPGPGGEWVREIPTSNDRHIKQHPGRRGYYADGIWLDGKEAQHKLGDTIEEAREAVAKLIEQRNAKQANKRVHCITRPLPKSAQPLHVQLRGVGRQLLRLYQQVQALEAKGGAA